MRICCQSVENFIANIDGSPLVDTCVWAQVTRNPIGEDSHSTKYIVHFQASAVKSFVDGGEALVEMGVECGFDYCDNSQDYAGSEKAAEYRDMLVKYCEERGLIVRPGKLDM